MSAPLVGRDREVAELSSALEAALGGDGGVVLISGEPGIGKSRLLEDLGERARHEGATALFGRCWEAGGAPPYWPWVQALRPYLRSLDPDELRAELGVGAADLAQMIPEVHDLLGDLPEPPESDPEQARFRVFDSAASFLRTAAERTPLVIVLDDLQAADTASLLFLRFLARELTSARLLIAAGYRDTEVQPDHPLAEALAELLREPRTRQLRLRGLGVTDVARYLGAIPGVADAATMAATIHDSTEGNPLFVVEVARLLAEEDLPADPGSWRLRIPQSVRELIGQRLAKLSDACTRILTAAAVLGREFHLAALAPLAEVGGGELLALIDEAATAAVVEEVPAVPGRMRFSHVLLRESLYGELTPSQRLHLHRRAAEVIEALHGDDLDVHLAELAHHYGEAAPEGDATPAVRYARLAGERALELLAHEEAARQFERALRALDLTGDRSLRERESERGQLLLALGEAHARSGDKAAAREAFRRVAELAERIRDPDLLGHAALGYGGRFVWEASRDDPNLAILLQQALNALPPTDSVLRVRLMARLSGGPWRDDPNREPRERMSREAVEMARRLGDVPTLGYALDGRYAAVWWPDNLEERIPIAHELVEVARAAGDLERELQAHHYLCLALMERGAMPGARTELRAQREIADRLRQPAQRLYVSTVEAMFALFEARFADAEKLIEHAHEIGSGAEGAMAEIYRAMQLVVLRTSQGRGEEAIERLRGAAAAFPSYVVLRCVLAWGLALLGRTDEVRSVVDELSADGFTRIPRNDEWVFAMAMLGEAIARADMRKVAQTVREDLLPYRDRLGVSAPEASSGAVARSLGLLAGSLEVWEEAEADLSAAVDLNDRCDARLWAAWARLDLAGVLRRRGDRERAEREARAALRAAIDLDAQIVVDGATRLLRDLGVALSEDGERVTRTFLFTDIEGSTSLLEAIGDEAWRQLRTWHNRTLRDLFAAHGGEEVDQAGDGFFVAFEDPTAAVRCSIEIQQRLAEHRAAHGFAPRVRIGVHTADASVTDDGYAGKGVHEAARIGALATGDEILISSSTLAGAQGVGGVGPERTVTLKGIADPVAVRALAWRAERPIRRDA